MYTEGYNVSVGLANGITAGRSHVINAVAAMCSAAVREARSELDINSPSKVFEQLGGFTAEGFGIGYEKKMGDVNRIIRDSMEVPELMGKTNIQPLAGTGVSEELVAEIPIYINGIYDRTEIVKFVKKDINNGQKYNSKGIKVNTRIKM